MSLAEYAQMMARSGTRVIGRNGCFWRQVRPFFYRPLLPVERHEESRLQPPGAWPRAFQYAIADDRRANSKLNFIMLDDPQAYSLDGVKHRRRQLIRRAAQQFQVRPLGDPDELKEHGHRAYLSFYERTRYAYRTDRRKKAAFAEWIDTLFGCPKTILLGGYGPKGLAGLSASYWVNDTLVYSTLICDTESMQRNLGGLMFHEVRQLAAQQSRIKRVLVRPFQGGNSHDQYYLLRGCRLVSLPARLEMPFPIKASLRLAMPRKYNLLCGNF